MYEPFDGSRSYRLIIRATQDGFYEFEGRREGLPRPVLQVDRAGEGALYRGEVEEGFDACIPAGARFELLPASEDLLFGPVMPVTTPVERTLPGSCGAARRFFLSAKGRGDDVRLRPISELAGMPRDQQQAGEPEVRGAGRTGTSSEGRPPAASMALGAPSAREGTPVEVLGSLRDGNGRLWHHVRVLSGAAGGETERGRDEGDRKSSGLAGSTSDRGPQAGEPGRRAAPSGAPGNGSASGYVPPENLVVRWDCRLGRVAPSRDPAGQKEPVPK